MKSYFRILNAAVTAVAAAVALSSCTSEVSFDEESFDTTVNVGGDAFSLPLGSTAEFAVGDFLNISEGDIIKVDDDGNYYIAFNQTFGQEISMNDFADRLTVPGLTHSLDPKSIALPEIQDIDGLPDGIIEELPGVELDGENIRVGLGFDEEFAYEFGFEEAAEYGLVSIDRVNLEETYIRPVVELDTDGEIPSSLSFEVSLEVPEHYVFEDSPQIDNATGTITFTGTMRADGVMEFEPVTLVAIDFDPSDSGYDEFVFTDDFAVRNSAITCKREDFNLLSGKTLDVSLTVLVGSEDGSLTPLSFVGKVDIKIDPVEELIALEGIPDILKSEDVSLDFYAPSITASVSTNAGVPVDLIADIVPVFGGSDGGSLHLDMSTPVSEDPAVTETGYYWISSERPSDLAPEYEWIEADVRSLLRQIPDEVRIEVNAGTDPTQSAYVVCNSYYDISGEFSVNVPFSFGDDLYLAAKDTIPDLPSILSTVVRSANVIIKGEVTSTIPVNVNLKAYFLDERGDRVNGIPEVEQMIESAGADGTPVLCPLELSIPKSDVQQDICSMVLVFELLPGSEPGLPLSESSSVKADVVLEIPGGVTLDINDLDEFTYNY